MDSDYAYLVFTEVYITANSAGNFDCIVTTSTLGVSSAQMKQNLVDQATSAMPKELVSALESCDATKFLELLHDEYNDENDQPAWWGSLPESVSVHIRTQYVPYEAGLDMMTSKVLSLITGSDGKTFTTMVSGHFIQFRERSWSSILATAPPARVLLAANDFEGVRYAKAVYSALIEDPVRAWFTSMPSEVQSYLILDFLPAHLDEAMTLDILKLAQPGATATSGPAATSASSVTAGSSIGFPPDPALPDPNHSGSKNVAIIAGTVVPIMSLIFGIAFGIWLVRRRKAKKYIQTSRPPHYFDPEQALRRWSETTFSTGALPSSTHPQQSPDWPTGLGGSPAADVTRSIRRTLSDSDLRTLVGSRSKSLADQEAPTRAELEAPASPHSVRSE